MATMERMKKVLQTCTMKRKEENNELTKEIIKELGVKPTIDQS